MNFPENEIEHILRVYGQEKFSKELQKILLNIDRIIQLRKHWNLWIL